MCGRFSLAVELSEVMERFHVRIGEEMSFHPRYNVAPTQLLPIIIEDESLRTRRLKQMEWGLIPRWVKDESTSKRLINARSETVLEKPAFRRSFRRHRCLVPADGYFEWQTQEDGSKRPLHIVRKDRELFAFAGLWDQWISSEGKEKSTFTIITREADEEFRPIHQRMPVMLEPEAEETWIYHGVGQTDTLLAILAGVSATELEVHPVSTMVNSVHNDQAECVKPL
ncbi:SOS response-associated peptidase [Mechercharimyces sp. CAU 1602]|nr:SOS response-associated peptidase [Mechercharimyces sp. CAU 1602]